MYIYIFTSLSEDRSISFRDRLSVRSARRSTIPRTNRRDIVPLRESNVHFRDKCFFRFFFFSEHHCPLGCFVALRSSRGSEGSLWIRMSRRWCGRFDRIDVGDGSVVARYIQGQLLSLLRIDATRTALLFFFFLSSFLLFSLTAPNPTRTSLPANGRRVVVPILLRTRDSSDNPIGGERRSFLRELPITFLLSPLGLSKLFVFRVLLIYAILNIRGTR